MWSCWEESAVHVAMIGSRGWKVPVRASSEYGQAVCLGSYCSATGLSCGARRSCGSMQLRLSRPFSTCHCIEIPRYAVRSASVHVLCVFVDVWWVNWSSYLVGMCICWRLATVNPAAELHEPE
jgi:hypothetical protein